MGKLDEMFNNLGGPILCPVCHHKTCSHISMCQNCSVHKKWEAEIKALDKEVDEHPFNCPEFGTTSTEQAECGCELNEILKYYIEAAIGDVLNERNNLHAQIYYLRKLMERRARHYENLLAKYKDLSGILDTYVKESKRDETK